MTDKHSNAFFRKLGYNIRHVASDPKPDEHGFWIREMDEDGEPVRFPNGDVLSTRVYWTNPEEDYWGFINAVVRDHEDRKKKTRRLRG